LISAFDPDAIDPDAIERAPRRFWNRSLKKTGLPKRLRKPKKPFKILVNICNKTKTKYRP